MKRTPFERAQADLRDTLRVIAFQEIGSAADLAAALEWSTKRAKASLEYAEVRGLAFFDYAAGKWTRIFKD